MKTRLLSTIICVLIAAGLNAQTVPTPDHVVVLVMENHGYSEIIGTNTGAPYINSLAVDSFAALFTNSLAITHPSQPNYLYLFSGASQGVLGDLTPASFQLPFTTANLGAELISAGRTFKGFSEDLPSVGFTGDTYNNYARKHAPWVNWQGNTAANHISASLALPFDSFPTNYNNLPTLCWVIPNLNDDMHNGTIAQGDAWVQAHMDSYIQWAKTHNSLLILTYDEDENSTGNSTPITTIFIGQMVKMGQYTEQIDHNRVLRTMEDMYGLGHAGASSTPAPITDCWVYKPVSKLGATPLTICQGQAITVTDSSANSPTGWVWSFPGGTPPSAVGQHPPFINYNGPGTFNITLVTNNHMGYDTVVKTAYITVNPSPSISLTNDSVFICRGQTATLTSNGAASYTWLPGNSIISNTGNTLTANPSTNSTYRVTGSTNGCHGDTVSAYVLINPPSTYTINTSICSGSSYAFKGQNISVAGSYVDTLTAANTCDSIVTLNLGVNQSLSSSTSVGICTGDSYSFNGQTLSNAGTYTDTVQAIGGCDSVVSLMLTVNSLPVISWGNGADTVYSNGNAVPLTGASPAGGTFSGAGVFANAFYPDSVGPGSYTITYSYTDGNNCMASATKTYVVIVAGIGAVAEAELALYPNPAQNQLTVKCGQFDITGAQPVVFDVMGRVVSAPITKRSDGLLIDAHLLAGGTYCIKIQTNDHQLIGRFVKGE